MKQNTYYLIYNKKEVLIGCWMGECKKINDGWTFKKVTEKQYNKCLKDLL